MTEHDQGDDAEPAEPTLDATQARAMAASLREAMDYVQRSVTLLAARVRDAHAARIWTHLGYTSWETFCTAEYGISRAQAYRLLDVARALGAIQTAVTAGTELSRTRDTEPAATAALDYDLSQRAPIAVFARSGDVAELDHPPPHRTRPQRPTGRPRHPHRHRPPEEAAAAAGGCRATLRPAAR